MPPDITQIITIETLDLDNGINNSQDDKNNDNTEKPYPNRLFFSGNPSHLEFFKVSSSVNDKRKDKKRKKMRGES